jgi:hypothetical protein
LGVKAYKISRYRPRQPKASLLGGVSAGIGCGGRMAGDDDDGGCAIYNYIFAIPFKDETSLYTYT